MHQLFSRKTAAAAVGAVALAAIPATAEHSARADSSGASTLVGAYSCIVGHGGHVTRPAGSTIVIHQGVTEQLLGVLQNFLGAQTTLESWSDGQMIDESGQWRAPFLSNGLWASFLDVPTGVTLTNAGDQMRFTFSLVVATKVPEVFNPAGGGEPGQPLPNGPGLSFGGTCTVTAT